MHMEKLQSIELHKLILDVMTKVRTEYSECKEFPELMIYLPKVIRLLNEITIKEVSGEENRAEKK